jgi:paraquat-inducible protein A
MTVSPPPPADRLIPPILLLATAALALGVSLPVVEVSNLAIFANRFSIAEAAWRLLMDEQFLLGTVIVVFSVIFPFGKIVAAAVLWLRLRTGGEISRRWIAALEFFGRWSCADVLLVAIAIVVTKSTGVADARMEIGIWFFAGSILLTAVGVHRLKGQLRKVD